MAWLAVLVWPDADERLTDRHRGEIRLPIAESDSAYGLGQKPVPQGAVIPSAAPAPSVAEDNDPGEALDQSSWFAQVQEGIRKGEYNISWQDKSVIEGEDGKATVEWSSEFDTVDAPEADITKMVEGLYSAGFDNLKKMFGG